MPLTIRAKGVSLSTSTNWAFNFLVGETTPFLQEYIGWRLYPMHGFYCVCSFILVYFLYPETKGVPLEEMDVVFGEDELEERLDNEDDEDDSYDETSSLLGDGLPTNNQAINQSGPRRRRSSAGWISRMFKRRNEGISPPA